MTTMPSDPPPETFAETIDLPDAERRRRRRDLVITAAVLAAIAAVVVVERRITSLPEALPSSSSLLFLLLNAVNVILVVLLVYLIARDFVKLFFERRRGILGSHLHLKFVSRALPGRDHPDGLSWFPRPFVTSSLETWFSLRVDGALERSREVADAYYDAWAEKALHFGDRLAEEIRARSGSRAGPEGRRALGVRGSAPARVRPRGRPGVSGRRRGAPRHP